MYLETVGLRNFRSFEDEHLCLSRNMTILVGENNGGKSNAIDSIRLVTAPLGGRREIYCEPTDVRFDSKERSFEISATFAELTIPQQGRFISVVTDHTLESAVFGITYDEGKKKLPVRPNLWGGHLKSTPEAGCHEMIRHVYLPPLRDAKRALASGNPSRIYALLNHFLGDEDPDELAKRLSRAQEEPILKNIDTAVDDGLMALTAGVRRQTASLGFNTNEKLIDIARDLRFKLADYGIEPEDLRYTGHGYANLLYIATIAVELENASDADLTLFLVEEPEAHLHPQLQAAVLHFLEERAEKSKDIDPSYKGPAGQLQVIVATHSPNLSAWVPNENVVVLKSVLAAPQVDIQIQPHSDIQSAPSSSTTAEVNQAAPITTETEAIVQIHASPPIEDASSEPVPAIAANEANSVNEPSPGGHVVRRSTRCIPLKHLALSALDRRKVDRYLDVTKSALLFGGRVLLVEGIAEALLLPIIAKKIVLRDRPEEMRIFRSTVFVPIEGVDFECYVRLLLTPHNRVHVADRVVIITDGDQTKAEQGKANPGEQRKTSLEEIAVELGAASLLSVETNTYSLESELVIAGNNSLLKRIYPRRSPKSGHL